MSTKVKKGPVAEVLKAAAFALILATTGPAAAQTDALAAANQATFEAYVAGDADTALDLAQTAVQLGRSQPAPDPLAFAFALNNLGYFLMQRDAGTAMALFDEVLSLQRATQPWLYALQNKAVLTLKNGQPDQTKRLVFDLISAARGTPFHATTAGIAADLLFQIGDFGEMTAMLDEMIALENVVYSATTLDMMYQRQLQGEAAGEIDAVSALIDARMALVQVLAPDQYDAFAHAALWTKFFINYEAEHYGVAADALTVWAQTGTLTESEADFIDSQASAMVLSTQLSGFSQGRTAQLGLAQLTLAYAQLLPDPTDVRRGQALRELAAAQTALGHHDAAAETLQRALAVLEQSAQGRRETHLTLADLGANAWQRDQPDLAAALYANADRQYDAALADGAAPLGPLDQSIAANNRARVALAQNQPNRAATLLAQAWQGFEADQTAGPQKTNQMAHEITLHGTQALIYLAQGQDDKAATAARRAAESSRTILPDLHPDRALALGNAADLLFVLDAPEQATAYLEEAAQIYADTTADDTPFAVETNVKIALQALISGHRAKAIEILRQVTQARKSPTYRAALPSASENFEMLAWALLDSAMAPDPAALNEAFEAVQWTQISRSATALAMLETRVAATDPTQSVLLRRRQNVTEAVMRNRSALSAAYAGDTSAQDRAALHHQQETLGETLARIETDLTATGLTDTGLVGVSPLGLTDVQALLGPDEAMVTFLLPSLKPGIVAGLTASSNFAIAVTQDSVQIARIPEISRGHLNDRVTEFRCQIAVSEPNCTTTGAAQTRGAMMLNDPDDAGTGFDQYPAQALYSDLFGGVQATIKDKSHLILVPPGDLLRLPFQALITDISTSDNLADIPWLLRRHAISVIPSVPSLRTLRGNGAARSDTGFGQFLGVGDPDIGAAPAVSCGQFAIAALRSVPTDFPAIAGQSVLAPLADPARLAQLPRLPDASCEIQAIAQTFDPAKSSVLLQTAATESAIKQMDQTGSLQDFDVLVFATHGLISGQSGAAAPGLVLTPPAQASELDDGLLTAAEIAILSLDAKLVVLSACNTAAGDSASDEGLSGLARAFFHAGARSLMVTHWSVYSEAAVEVSTGLFSTLRANPSLSHAEALRQTALNIIDTADATGFRSHPSYWAAFAMIGVD